MVFGGFPGFCSGFRILDHKTTVKTKTNHEFLILKHNLNILLFFGFLDFTMVLVGCPWFLVFFLGFCSGCEFLTT